MTLLIIYWSILVYGRTRANIYYFFMNLYGKAMPTYLYRFFRCVVKLLARFAGLFYAQGLGCILKLQEQYFRVCPRMGGILFLQEQKNKVCPGMGCSLEILEVISIRIYTAILVTRAEPRIKILALSEV